MWQSMRNGILIIIKADGYHRATKEAVQHEPEFINVD